MTGRLEKSPDEVVRRLIIEPGLERDLAHHFEYFLDVNTAHLVMLVEAGIVDAGTAAKIQAATDEMRQAGPRALRIDPALEDLYFNIEANLMARVGAETGGKLHTARSRNDMLATVARLRLRSELVEVCHQLLTLRRRLLALAAEHVETVITGYTHLQAAEPITVGHYLSAALHTLQRDHARLRACLADVNSSPLGSGALASTTFDIDRSVTAELLGFETVMGNSLDGVASRDYMADVLGALAILTNNLGRFAQDLYVWASGEFNLVEVDSSIAVTSSIMPQKKNPVTLEHIKAKAAHLQACWISCLGALKSSGYSHSRESSVESLRFVWDGVAEGRVAVELFEHTVTSLTFNTELAGERAAADFSSVTELANELVRHHGLPFRTAHHIVGAVVADCLASGRTARDIDPDVIAAASLRVLGHPIDVSPELVARSLAPLNNVAGRTAEGGPAPREVHRQLSRLSHVLDEDEAHLSSVVAARRQAAESLRARAAALAAGRVHDDRTRA
ncbi:argininosuccinate lyase [Marinitenerispora sediminis]|uniref:argininosuccinate lyase n=1 Tax=Marinitenerispora sediminis TaxID=1931232 RepID=UPI0015F13EFD|nr:argininosuccinate lyase [Marinitenerispora sediminis]